MVSLMFGGVFRFDLDDVNLPNNDRLIFSKGHASPLYYALFAAAGRVSEAELMSLRKFDSPLEGHPSMRFKYTEAATGSLGQGLAIGAGMAANAKYLDKLPYKTYVLMGDSEMAEGSIWETIQLASYYKLNNLTGIIDVNRLGQSSPTMLGHDIDTYGRRVEAFGWRVAVVEDGHDLNEVARAYSDTADSEQPVMIIARTIKGKGVSFLEDKEGWHGKPLKKDQLETALAELGSVDMSIRGEIDKPEDRKPSLVASQVAEPVSYELGQKIATREAYGRALVRLALKYPELVVLDAEVNNSTHTDYFKKAYGDRFFQMFIAEQNMVGMAAGFSRRNKVPFVSTFATFLSRAYDQIRMSPYSSANIKFAGSHVGVSIGEDGTSQMGLADIALFRTIFGSVVLYPSDAVSVEQLVDVAAKHKGSVYIRLTRMSTPVIYENEEEFVVGGSKVLRTSNEDAAAVIAAGVTLYEALAAYDELEDQGILIRVIDLYSIKPIDRETIVKAASETNAIITVEDHYAQGGLGEAVLSALADNSAPVHMLAVDKMPRSGRPDELLDYENISKTAIVNKVKELIKNG